MGIHNFIFIITGSVSEPNPIPICASLKRHMEACHEKRNRVNGTKGPLVKDVQYGAELREKTAEGVAFIERNNWWSSIHDLSLKGQEEYSTTYGSLRNLVLPQVGSTRSGES